MLEARLETADDSIVKPGIVQDIVHYAMDLIVELDGEKEYRGTSIAAQMRRKISEITSRKGPAKSQKSQLSQNY